MHIKACPFLSNLMFIMIFNSQMSIFSAICYQKMFFFEQLELERYKSLSKNLKFKWKPNGTGIIFCQIQKRYKRYKTNFIHSSLKSNWRLFSPENDLDLFFTIMIILITSKKVLDEKKYYFLINPNLFDRYICLKIIKIVCMNEI